MRLCPGVLLAAVLLCVFSSPAESQRVLQTLGPFEGRPTVAAAINDAGVVVGNGFNAAGAEIPLMWTPAGGYDAFLGSVTGRAHDINNRGDVVGILFQATGSPAFLYWPGVLVFIAAGIALLGLTVRAITTGAWSGAAFVLAFLALFLWQAGTFFHRNRPGSFDPSAVPPQVLPRG